MSSVNQVNLLGNLGREPEVITFQNGGRIARLSVATSDRWLDQRGEWQEHTEWHTVVLRDRTAELYAPRLQKGTKVFVNGAIRSHRYTDKNNIERTSYEITCHSIKIVSGAVDTQNNQHQQAGHQQEPQTVPQAQQNHMAHGNQPMTTNAEQVYSPGPGEPF